MTSTARTGGPAPIEIAHAAMALYPVSSASRAELVRYGENTTYRVRDGRRSIALRLARPGYQSRASTESEIAWMSALREHGVDTPVALRGSNGDFVQLVGLPEGGVQMAVAFEWVDGVPLPEVQELQPWTRLGEIMARVHEHGRGWSPPPGFIRPTWDLEALVGDSPRWGTPVPDDVWSVGDRRTILLARDAVRERLRADPHRLGVRECSRPAGRNHGGDRLRRLWRELVRVRVGERAVSAGGDGLV
jgi:Ser/Thr protein kinase RdoA (MazF antagonist)